MQKKRQRETAGRYPRAVMLEVKEVDSRINDFWKPVFHHRMPDGKLVFCGYKRIRKPKRVTNLQVNTRLGPHPNTRKGGLGQ